MIVEWWRRRRRAKILTTPFPAAWKEIIAETIPQAAFLTDVQQARFRRLTQIFVAEKNWEGCNGLELTEEMRVVIAGMASLLVAGFPEEEYYDHVLSILVYPESYIARNTQMLGAGTVIEGPQARIGEAWYRGPVIVSWADIQQTATNATFGRNVVLHEFAHQLDMLNGRVADGNPILPSHERFHRWEEVMQQGFGQLSAACRQGRPTLIDCYGGTSRAEFFAVVTELFFEGPTPLRHWHPDIYRELSTFYGLDPANWGQEE